MADDSCKTVKIFLDHEDAQLPHTAYAGDVGYDLYAIEDVEIPYGLMREVKTGVHLIMPEGVFAQINTRSSYGSRGLFVHHGVIDQGYTGEVTLWIFNISTGGAVKEPFTIKKGDKIAQLLFHKAEYVNIEKTDELPETERGAKGNGSTGN